MSSSTPSISCSAPLETISTDAFDRQDALSRCLDFFKVAPKPEQLEVVATLARCQDCILIAGCGWGKTPVYFLPLILWLDRVIFAISPLKALAVEQQQKLHALGIRSVAILGETIITPDMFKSLSNGVYRAVFISPERALSNDRIKNLWRQPGWRKRLFAVVVDEAHCIDSMGDHFRQEYGSVGDLRCMVRYDTPFLATSATLPPRVLENIKESLHFRPDTHTINIGNDLPNIKFIATESQHPMDSFRDLKFLKDFRKTIVFFNTCLDAEGARRYLVGELGLDSSRIAVYHAFKTDDFKSVILERFRNDKVLLLLATEAAVGMGCDINSIVRVVQYRRPPSLVSLIQRLDRALRNTTLQCTGLAIVPQFPSRGPVKDATDKDLLAFLYTKACRRKVLNGVFGNKHHEDGNANCCDNCHPEQKPVEIVRTDPEGYEDAKAKAANKRVPRRTEEKKAIARQAIEDWRTATWKRDFSLRTLFFRTPQFVMSDQVLKTLADEHAKVVAADSIKSFLNWGPPDRKYIQELTDILMDINKNIIAGQGEKRSSSNLTGDTPSLSTNSSLISPPVMPPRPKKSRPQQDTYSFINRTPPSPLTLSAPEQARSPSQQPSTNLTGSPPRSSTPPASTHPHTTPTPTTLTPSPRQKMPRQQRNSLIFVDRNNWTAARYLI
ncbi:hypothetical protein BGX30_010830 [Mortierella sp. GBA39]|nr:hypothetical protein BGX30_010830 [Mortierella sp. GBA39]